jgi:HEAT repeat protein
MNAANTNRNADLLWSGTVRVLELLFLTCSLGSCLSSTNSERTYTPTEIYAEQNPAPTLPSTLDELIASLSSDDDEARIVAMRGLSQVEAEASSVVPLLINNLDHENSEVRRVAVVTLGEIGPAAFPAIPQLIGMLSSDPNINIRRIIPQTLGNIGEKTVVPELAEALYSEDDLVAINAAETIAALAGEEFISSGSEINDAGVPKIVADAREWWKTEGQFEDWTD